MECSKVPGLFLIDDFISKEEEDQLLATLDGRAWGGKGQKPNEELRRRTQQYGYLFSFRTRQVEEHLGPLPAFVDGVVERMRAFGVFAKEPPEYLLVNEYERGQGIMPHVDASTFGSTVTSLSLLTPCVMTFSKRDSGESVDILLRPRSLLVLTGDSRYNFTHSISKNQVDHYCGEPIERGRRVSLTFRRRAESS
ncbi:uncharacterized protein SPPG_09218 [Spizellomyces punctatus DAOM BR117]|uniref:Fe2OG dioxygenase domain-containing protein n=1 Tax=Spizellomyces punctatus (strain DAOM BR117) TaxID=645134 RepID=A0A0L0HHS4_SPIPD|nr:uncharacterized protein SPPG_09218 [Spizellomyces punctatus DAOM BR117]KND00415.1 hypothetical protein SPPG_09218 [Spizellomyces punctatus DAOM BR117]|eukprot:XP_016608454.1 hypothetical protein SPPG_09218 [Spizellomyces punctatus DAOM BR117]